jgi:hypothetical protein
MSQTGGTLSQSIQVFHELPIISPDPSHFLGLPPYSFVHRCLSPLRLCALSAATSTTLRGCCKEDERARGRLEESLSCAPSTSQTPHPHPSDNTHSVVMRAQRGQHLRQACEAAERDQAQRDLSNRTISSTSPRLLSPVVPPDWFYLPVALILAASY